jgi:hypothetical protein
VTDSLDLQGAPAWEPGGQSITSAVDDHGVPRLFGESRHNRLCRASPARPDPDSGRSALILPGGRQLVFLRGEIQHKDFWMIDLETGAQRQLTNLSPDFNIRDFDISPDGGEVVLERVQERSDVVLLDLPRR